MSSKFKGILDLAKGREPEPEPVAAGAPPLAPPSPAPPEAPRRGRPPGKRSDPAYAQVTAYIPEELHRKVKIALLMEAEGREFSQLVEALLSDWLGSRP
jgi:hypothetical protein